MDNYAYEDAEILLVEDNPADLQLTLHVLKKHRLANRIQVARDGAEALDFIFSTGPREGKPRASLKVILLDVKLPKVSGMEVLRKIKSDPLTRTIPVVLLTSSREQRDVEEGYNLGANSYIVKAVDFEHFAKCVADIGLYWLLQNEVPKHGHHDE